MVLTVSAAEGRTAQATRARIAAVGRGRAVARHAENVKIVVARVLPVVALVTIISCPTNARFAHRVGCALAMVLTVSAAEGRTAQATKAENAAVG